ncbi:MAG: glycerol-3-phosphate 1-O-acyltransferase PlsY [Oscillospiraceae bacterium]|nr:glycerol-3-phosphate 1-O-acyltransferase PlsY [Oscillospiraceae bacterium]
MGELFEFGLCNKFYPGSNIHIVISYFVVIIIGYLLGSLNFGVIISKVVYHDDIRKHGSKNAGATNMLRTYGKIPAAATFLGDGLKTVVAVYIGALFLGTHNTAFYTQDGVIYQNTARLAIHLQEVYGNNIPDLNQIPGLVSYMGFAGMYFGGLASIIGHAFPIYYRFKGGKGVVATAVMVLCTEPLVFAILIVIFIGIVAITKFISLGSIMSVLIYPFTLNQMTGFGLHDLIAILITLFIVYLHRENIVRLVNGTESKISFGKKDKKQKEKS